VEMEPGARVKICRPEDLIVMKAFADRPQDWLDVKGILIRQKERPLDWGHIRKHLKVLAKAKESPELVDKLEAMRKDAG